MTKVSLSLLEKIASDIATELNGVVWPKDVETIMPFLIQVRDEALDAGVGAIASGSWWGTEDGGRALSDAIEKLKALKSSPSKTQG